MGLLGYRGAADVVVSTWRTVLPWVSLNLLLEFGLSGERRTGRWRLERGPVCKRRRKVEAWVDRKSYISSS